MAGESDIREATAAPACPACGQAAAGEFFRDGAFTLLACGDCGLIYLERLPSGAEAEALYGDDYGDSRQAYIAKAEAKMRRSRRRMRGLRRRVPAGRFLDVGCNVGYMVEAAREQGFEAWGIDLDAAAVAHAQAAFPLGHFRCAHIEDFAAEAAPFDLVYCSEVIEHVPAVDRFVAAIARTMKPGALLYLTTPDIGHWRRPRDLRAWDGYNPPRHCLYFTPASLRRLLAKHGLHVLRRQPNWKPGIKLLARKAGG